MSTILEAMRAVRHSALPSPARHLMMTLLSLANPSTCVIPDNHTPSLTDLTRFTGLARSTVATHLNMLEEKGWLKRDKPTVPEAWGAKVRTRYFVQVPTSPGDGLVQEADQSGSRTSPGGGPDLVREPDCTSPGAVHVVPGHTGLTGLKNTSRQSGGRESAETTPKPRNRKATKPKAHSEPGLFDVDESEQDTTTENAGAINKAWIAYCADNNVKLTGEIIKRYGAGIKTALGEKFDSATIRKALGQMFKEQTTSRPSLLPSYIVRVQQGGELPPERAPRPSTTDQRVTDGLRVAAELKAQRLGADQPSITASAAGTPFDMITQHVEQP